MAIAWFMRMEAKMTAISSAVTIGLQNRVQTEFKSGPDEFTKDLMVREKEWLTRELAYNPYEQLAAQNAQEVHTAFRLNGKLAGTIDENGGFTGSGLSDGGASQRAVAYAEKAGLKGAAFADYVSQKVSQALKERYGASLEVVTYDTGDRPTVGEIHSEMFGGASPQYEGMSSDRMAYIKHFAQMYGQTFGEDPFAALDVPYDDL
jgi:hypothetical protein